MENIKREMLECTEFKSCSFLGKDKLLIKCPYCTKFGSIHGTQKQSLKNLLEDGLDIEPYLCECSYCQENYYLYL